MRYNPLTKQLWTDDYRLIKRMECAYRMEWEKLARMGEPAARRCEVCEHLVHDTAGRTEAEVLALLAKEPGTCLKVNLSQDNMTLTHHNGKSR